jgi:hypothetical protein
MKEVWLKVIDTDLYEVSNLGGFKIRGRATYAEYPNEYRSISYKKTDGTTSYGSLHRMVYTYFKGEIPPKMTINHKDGNKSNNRIDNLECISRSENIKHAYNSGLFTTKNYKSFGKRNYKC